MLERINWNVLEPVIVFVDNVPTKLPPKKLLPVKLLAVKSLPAMLKLPTKLFAVIVPVALRLPVYVSGPVPDLPKLWLLFDDPKTM